MLGSSFVSLFFILISCYKWWVSRVNSSWLVFFPNFFFIFFNFIICIKSFAFELCYFSLLFLFCYFNSGLIKLIYVSLHFLSQCFFFSLTLVVFVRYFFWIIFFILISCCWWRVSWVNPNLHFFSLDFSLIFFFNFIILHKSICPWALSFFHFYFFLVILSAGW